jgi:signal transduction histidine kinase
LNVLLEHGSGPVRFEVRDEGPGFDAAERLGASAGSGLRNMADRAEAVGGEVLIESSPRGTVVSGWLPIP